ncbi:MAG TPA: GTPase Era [Longimicrobiales bacterium]
MKQETRAGDVALVGRPNVGKSTLLNSLVGEKLSIVTPRAQTTREAVTGLLTTETAQLIFVDTPGLLDPSYTLQRAMQETALNVLRDADLALLLLDATRPDELPAGDAMAALHARGNALYVAINKTDTGSSDNIESLRAWSQRELGASPVEIAAATGRGVRELIDRLTVALPVSPFFYPADELAVQPVRFFVAELIRETVFEEYEEEVPYSAVAAIDEYREASDPVYIRATVYVERETQKAIIVGKNGAGIRRLGERSRVKIEDFIGARVYLDLWVKTLPSWRKKVSALQYLGFPVPPELRAEADRDARAAGRHRKGRRSRQRSRESE